MNDMQAVLNAFAESVGGQIKALSASLNEEIKALNESIGVISGRIKAIEDNAPDASKAISDALDLIKTESDALQDAAMAKVDDLLLGLDVKDGEDGKDALQLEVLPGIDQSKSYPRGTYAMHNGGLFRAYQKTVEMKGWECVVNGVADMSIYIEGKTLSVSAFLSDGTVKRTEKTIPVPEYKGVFRMGDKYLKGDSSTHDGSLWIATVDEPISKPGNGDGWQLAVKRGRDGRGLYAIARDSGYQGTEKDLLAHIINGEQSDSVVRLKNGV